MRQIFSGLAAVVATVALGIAPAMACGGGGGLFTGCSPCRQVVVSPCGFHGGFSHAGFSHYQRLADPSPRYFWVNQGPVYDGPGQFAPRPFYQERTVTGWGGPAVVRRSHRVRTAHVNYGAGWHGGHHHTMRPGVRHVRRNDAAFDRPVPRATRPHPNAAPRFRDSGSYSYRSGFRDGSSRR